jgi:hypothetical protein
MKRTNQTINSKGENKSFRGKTKNYYNVVDISSEVCDLMEQSTLFLGKKEIAFTDKNGILVVIQEILAKKKKDLGSFNKLVIMDNRLKGRILVKTFKNDADAKEIVKFSLGNVKVAYPKSFLIHLLFSNRFMRSLFNNIFK